MAEIRKREKREEYKIEKDVKKKNTKREVKVDTKKGDSKQKKTNVSKEKKSLWTKFRIFCHGVKSETLRVHWPSKKDMVKYSVATVVFIVFCSLFFYLIDVIFALVQSLFN